MGAGVESQSFRKTGGGITEAVGDIAVGDFVEDDGIDENGELDKEIRHWFIVADLWTSEDFGAGPEGVVGSGGAGKVDAVGKDLMGFAVFKRSGSGEGEGVLALRLGRWANGTVGAAEGLTNGGFASDVGD